MNSETIDDENWQVFNKIDAEFLEKNADFFRKFNKSKYIKHKLDKKAVETVVQESYNKRKWDNIQELLKNRLKMALKERK